MTKQVKISRPNAHNNKLSSQCSILEAILIRIMTGYGNTYADAYAPLRWQYEFTWTDSNFGTARPRSIGHVIRACPH